MVPTVRESRKVWEKIRRSGKVREFYITKSGKKRGSGKVGENQSTMVQKLSKMQKNFELFCTDCMQHLKIFFCSFRSLIICISTFKFVPPPLVLVRLKANTGILHEQISRRKRFILSWKVRENEFCRVV